jgi:predicted GIY-YIG superfamily endonuclease
MLSESEASLPQQKRSFGREERSLRMTKLFMSKEYYIYIMTNKSRTLYTGVTNNLMRRVDEHKKRNLFQGLQANTTFNFWFTTKQLRVYTWRWKEKSKSRAGCEQRKSL